LVLSIADPVTIDRTKDLLAELQAQKVTLHPDPRRKAASDGTATSDASACRRLNLHHMDNFRKARVSKTLFDFSLGCYRPSGL
jgi:hypothetical protein